MQSALTSHYKPAPPHHYMTKTLPCNRLQEINFIIFPYLNPDNCKTLALPFSQIKVPF